MKRIVPLRFLLLVTALLAALLLAACGSPAPEPAPTAPAAPTSTPEAPPSPTNTAAPTATPDPMAGLEGRRLAAVFSGAADDRGWTGSAVAGLEALHERYGIETAWTENVEPDGREAALRKYAEMSTDYILAHGAEWDAAVAAVAPQFPNIRFIQTNGSASGLSNVYTVSFSAGEGGYFAGMIACLASKSGKAAYVAGQTYPVLDHEIAMSRQACKDLGKTVEFVEAYVGNWTDAERAKELTAAAIENGADVLILHAEAADAGAIAAAREAKLAGKPVLLVSWPRDKHAYAPDLILGGWEERAPALIEYALKQIAQGKAGGHFAIGIAEGAGGLNPFYGLVPIKLEKQIVDTLSKYRANPAMIPTLVVRTDL